MSQRISIVTPAQRRAALRNIKKSWLSHSTGRIRLPRPAQRPYTQDPSEDLPPPPEEPPPTPAGDTGVFGLYLRTAVTGPTGSSPVMVNGATDTWAGTEAGISTGRFIKGANADVYKTALANRGMNVAADWVETPNPDFPGYTDVVIKNASVKHFISMFDQTDIIHGFPPQYIKAIKDVSTVNTKVGFWFLSDRMVPGQLYSGWAEYVRQRQLPYLMVGTFAKNWGGLCSVDTTVDSEQTLPWYLNGLPGSPRCPANPSPPNADSTGHAWFIDFRNAAYPAAIAQALHDMHTSYWSLGASQPDTHCSDNMLKQFIPGLATNAPTISAATWGAGVEAVAAAIDASLMPLGYGHMWGNVGDPSRSVDYTNLKGHFWEHSFQQATLAASVNGVLAGLNDVAAISGCKVAISYRKGAYPAVNDVMFETPSQPYWDTILARARANSMTNRTMVGMFAEGTQGVLMWQPCMRVPV